MSTFDFSQWPPKISPQQLSELQTLAATYALSHGLVYLPPGFKDGDKPGSTIHAPFSIFPSPIPRDIFNLARRLQSIYNVLYSRVAADEDFLDRVMGAEVGAGKVDEFTGQLWRGWRAHRGAKPKKKLHLGLFRSDYLLHDEEGQPTSLKQVEFNTISSSFGPLSERSAAMHRYLHSVTNYFDTSHHLDSESFPENNTTAHLASGIAFAHKTYGNPRSYVLFVVQPGERNVFDQRWLEYELLEKHGIKVIRSTLEELSTTASIEPSSNALKLNFDSTQAPIEISVVYFRAGYTPNDYHTPKHYDTRFLLDRSSAINCPSIPLQLAGGKKVQQVLAEPGILEGFLSNSNKYGENAKKFTQEEIGLLRSSWMGMWGLDLVDDSGAEIGLQQAKAGFSGLVLKPQREGGGNNVYKEAIPSFLDNLPIQERQAWIAMELIKTPAGLGNYLVRANGTEVVKTEVISELGIFGWSLFGDGYDPVKEEEAGWLVRTKGKDSNEGGVATGFSVLDSVLLVD